MRTDTPLDPYARAPWVEAYPASVPREPVVPNLPLGQLLDEVVARFGPQTAVICRRTRITYLDLKTRVDRLAATLHRLGVHPGDRVAIVLPNTPEFVVSFFATLRLGAVAVPLNPFSTPAELGVQLADSGAQVAVCIDRAVPALQEVRSRTKLREILVTSLAEAGSTPLGLSKLLPLPAARRRRRELSVPVPKTPGVTRLADALRDPGKGVPHVTVDPDAAALLTYTSGTTGEPRATVLTHHNLIANGYQIGWWLPDVRPGREVALAVLPLFHPFGLVLGLQTTLLLGGTLILVPGLDQSEILAAFDAHSPTLFSAVPAVFRALLDNAELRAHRTAALRVGISIGAPLPPETARAYEQLTSSALVEGYGLAEAAITHAVPVGAARYSGEIGLPLPLTDARIVDPDEPTTVLDVGIVGELAVRGPQVSSRSWGGAGTPSAAGYVLTGDLASMDTGGSFTLVGRIADALHIGGGRISSVEIESAIAALPEVARVGVVAGADGPVAYVQLVSGAELSAGAVLSACERVLAADLVPVRVEFRDALPVTGVGSVLRRLLRTQEAAAATARAAEPQTAAEVDTTAAPAAAPNSPAVTSPVMTPPEVPAKRAPRKVAAKTTATKVPPRKVAPAKAPASKVAVKKATAKAATPARTVTKAPAKAAAKQARAVKATTPTTPTTTSKKPTTPRKKLATPPREDGQASAREVVPVPPHEEDGA